MTKSNNHNSSSIQLSVTVSQLGCVLTLSSTSSKGDCVAQLLLLIWLSDCTAHLTEVTAPSAGQLLDKWLVTGQNSGSPQAYLGGEVKEVKYEREGESDVFLKQHTLTHAHFLTAPSVTVWSRWVSPVAFIWAVHQSASPDGSRWRVTAQPVWRGVVVYVCQCLLGGLELEKLEEDEIAASRPPGEQLPTDVVLSMLIWSQRTSCAAGATTT